MKLKSLLLVVLAFLATVAAPAKKKDTTPEDQNKVYIFGFATTFDSDVVYITDIQELDSAFILKSGFLYSRDSYSYQLREHMRKEGVENAVTMVSFSGKKEKLEKRYLKLKKRYTNPKKKKGEEQKHYIVNFITADAFKFTAVPADESVIKKDAVWKAEQKELRKKAKAEKKANKRNIKQAKAERKAANKATIREQKRQQQQERKAK